MCAFYDTNSASVYEIWWPPTTNINSKKYKTWNMRKMDFDFFWKYCYNNIFYKNLFLISHPGISRSITSNSEGKFYNDNNKKQMTIRAD